MPAVAHQCVGTLPMDPPSLHTSYQQITGGYCKLARRKFGHRPRLQLAATCESASASAEGLQIGNQNLKITEEIYTAITTLPTNAQTMTQRGEDPNNVKRKRHQRLSRQPKRARTRPPAPDTA